MSFNKLTTIEKLLTKTERQGECLIWVGDHSAKGYGYIRLNGKRLRAHRVMFEIHHGHIPAGTVILHSCDNPACINIAHLKAGSQLDNVHDMLNKGRANKAAGERCASSKLTDAQVAEIRQSYKPRSYGHGSHALAKKYGVSKPTIRAILSGDSWKHLL